MDFTNHWLQITNDCMEKILNTQLPNDVNPLPKFIMYRAAILFMNMIFLKNNFIQLWYNSCYSCIDHIKINPQSLSIQVYLDVSFQPTVCFYKYKRLDGITCPFLCRVKYPSCNAKNGSIYLYNSYTFGTVCNWLHYTFINSI